MAFTSVSPDDEILAAHVEQYKDALEGADAQLYHLRQDPAAPFIIELGDNAGVEQFQITDSDDAVIFSIDSNGEMALREGLLFINGNTGGSASQWWIGRAGADDISINVPTGDTIDFLINNTRVVRIGNEFISIGNTVASDGAVRLENNVDIRGRNAANNGDLIAVVIRPDDGLVFGDGAPAIRIGNSPNAAIGFFGATPSSLPTGVAVTAAGIHAALVSLGLITA